MPMMRLSCRTADPFHLLSTPAALTIPRRPQSGCDGLSHLKEDTGEPSVPAREFNLIACRQKPDDMPAAAGVEPTPLS